MKLLFFSLVFFLLACKDQNKEMAGLKSQIDSLRVKLDNTYKPGLGDLMSSIQVHHNKLWFAGQQENWKLADFEIHEIGEMIDDVQKFEQERTETKAIGMIKPALDSVTDAIAKKDLIAFKNSYSVLTNTCNKCHRSVDFEFNVVKIPDTPPFSNQDFHVIK